MNFTHELLKWYAQNGRDLPWRATKDPYAIWLSEVILQQTRIAQGHDYWVRFMQQWPQVNDLAAATEDEVLRAWQGLGYYSRARNLHTAAKQIAALGYFPTTYNEIIKLKGVGEYTAAAIASIAYNEAVAVVDGNVYRVLARYFGIDTPIDTAEGKKTFRAMAQAHLSTTEPAAYNQAIMDFGAIQCTPKSPDCSACPLVETCFAYQNHKIDLLPAKSKKIKQRERKFQYVYIRCNNHIAIRRRGAGDIWQGLWEFPTTDALSVPLASLHLLQSNAKHVLTHQIIYADFYLYETATRPTLSSDFIWIEESEIDKYALPRLMEIMLKHLEKYH